MSTLDERVMRLANYKEKTICYGVDTTKQLVRPFMADVAIYGYIDPDKFQPPTDDDPCFRVPVEPIPEGEKEIAVLIVERDLANLRYNVHHTPVTGKELVFKQ